MNNFSILVGLGMGCSCSLACFLRWLRRVVRARWAGPGRVSYCSAVEVWDVVSLRERGSP
jgi:hypothetical protein